MIERVALLISYYYDKKKTTRLDDRGRVQILAGLELLDKNIVDVLVLAGGKVDSDRKSLGETMMDEIGRTRKIEGRVICSPVARSTYQEIKEFCRLTKNYHWNNLTIVCSELQLERIKIIRKRVFDGKLVIIKTSEGVLENMGIRYRKIVNKLRRSADSRMLKKQEAVLEWIMKLPGGLEMLELVVRNVKKKGKMQSLIKESLFK